MFSILKFPTLVFFIHVVFDRAGIYLAMPWIDMPMHFLGGASIAATGVCFLALLQGHGFINKLPLLFYTLFIMSFVGLAAASWELWEFSIDLVFKKNLQGDLFDTMIDMFFGFLGGFAMSTAWLYFKRKSEY